MKHFICEGGCKGVSENPVSCGANTCSKYNKALTECNCENTPHKFSSSKCENCESCEGSCDIELAKPELN